MQNIKEFFNDWIESDDAFYYLGCLLGVMEYHEDRHNELYYEYYRKIKGVFAVQTEIGTMLYEMLERMVKEGMLEKRDDWEYRWNQSYKNYWDSKD